MLTTLACVLLSLSTPSPGPGPAAAPALAAAPAAAPTLAASRIAAVTVHPDRAEVTREAAVQVAAGAQTILIGPLPDSMDEASLRVTGRGPAGAGLALGDVEVRRVDAVEVRGPDLIRAEAALEELAGQAAALDDRLARIERLRGLLGSLQTATAGQFAREMASTDLRPQSWQAAYDFLRRNLDDLDDEGRQTARRRAALENEIAVARSVVDGLKARRTLAHKVIAVSLESGAAAAATIEVRYAQPGASWSPSYEAVMDPDSGEVTLAMFGWVKQTTGERWDGVRLTLATGAPSLGIDLPRLGYSKIRSIALRLDGDNTSPPLSGAPGGDLNLDVLEEIEVVNNCAFAEFKGANGGFSADCDGGSRPAAPQAPPVDIVQKLAEREQSATVMTFQVPATVSLDPDGQPRRIAVSRFQVAARRDCPVIPSIRPAAFLRARVTVPADHPLLAGVVKHYVGSTLVGSSAMPAVAPGEDLVLSFGADDRVKVDRPALPQTAAVKGGRRVTTWTRRASLTNCTGGPIDVDLVDRVPVPTQDTIKASVSDATTGGYTVKEDEPGLYVRKLSLPPGAKKDVALVFTVRHPIGLTLASLK